MQGDRNLFIVPIVRGCVALVLTCCAWHTHAVASEPAPTVAFHTVESLGALLEDYEQSIAEWLPILMPVDSHIQFYNGGRRVFDSDAEGFPADFVSRLSKKGITDRGVMAYPVVVRLHPETHTFILEAYDGTRLTHIKRPADYDPLWYADEALTSGRITEAELDTFARTYNPARIVGQYELLTTEGAEALADIEAAEAAARTTLQAPMMMTMSAPSSSPPEDLCFSSIQAGTPGSNQVTLTIGYPSQLRGIPLSIVGCTNLTDWAWTVVASTNAASGADMFDHVVASTLARQFFACYRTDLPEADIDGDGVADGEERYLDGTDPDDPNDPASISGGVTYPGIIHAHSGAAIVIRAYDFATWTQRQIEMTAPGDYIFTKLEPGQYQVQIFVDHTGDRNPQFYEPYVQATNMIVSGKTGNVDFDLEDVYSDNDYLPDWWEYMHFGDLAESDTGDGEVDGLNNLNEYYAGSDPNDVDTDSDGMGDGAEWLRGLNPVLPPTGYTHYSTWPFVDDFEAPEIAAGELNGQNQWTSSPAGQVLVQTNETLTGSQQAIESAAGAETPRMEHLVGAVGQATVWIDSYVKVDHAAITPYRDHPNIGEVPPHVVSVFAMNCDGDIYAYDGSSSQWVLATPAGGLSGDSFHRITVKQDYVTKRWDLYIDSVLRQSQLGFRDPSVTELTQFAMTGTKSGGCYCDDISIGSAKPNGIP